MFLSLGHFCSQAILSMSADIFVSQNWGIGTNGIYLVNRGQECCQKSYNVQDIPSIKNYVAPRGNSDEIEKLCPTSRCSISR